MNLLPTFPPEVHRFVAKAFGDANRQISEQIAFVPNCPEPSLDLALIAHLSRYSGARVVAPGWAVRIDVHYLGGLRHLRSWEVADIGVFIFAKQSGAVLSQKVALLQSKRLYPKQGIIEETEFDYHLGMSRLVPGAFKLPSLALSHRFDFSDQSKYGALVNGDKQFDIIEEYEKKHQIPVHYLLYNPWEVGSSYQLPVTTPIKLGSVKNGGARVIPATNLRAALSSSAAGYSPTFSDVATAISSKATDAHGWRLEHFMSQLVMKCQQGALFDSADDENMYALFNRRSGPIAAAVAVTIEQFGKD